jgi:L-amino acid N-acyltransferase YncA
MGSRLARANDLDVIIDIYNEAIKTIVVTLDI